MSAVRRAVALASLLAGTSACDRGCSSQPVERTMLTKEAVARAVWTDHRADVVAPTDVGAPAAASGSIVHAVAAVPPPPSTATELDGLVLPDGHSTPPTKAEWSAAKRLHTQHAHCRAKVVREWMTMTCDLGVTTLRTPNGQVRVLAGDPSEVSTWFWTQPPAKEGEPEPPPLPSVVAATFPIRRGDVRLMELTFVESGAKFSVVSGYTISVAWLEGMPSPEVTVTD